MADGNVVLEATGGRKIIGKYVFGKLDGYAGDCAVVDADTARRLLNKPVNCHFRLAIPIAGDEAEPKRGRGKAK